MPDRNFPNSPWKQLQLKHYTVPVLKRRKLRLEGA